jgi:hypothetical protein
MIASMRGYPAVFSPAKYLRTCVTSLAGRAASPVESGRAGAAPRVAESARVQDRLGLAPPSQEQRVASHVRRGEPGLGSFGRRGVGRWGGLGGAFFEEGKEAGFDRGQEIELNRIEVGAGIIKLALIDFNASEVDVNALSLFVVGGKAERIIPGIDGLAVEIFLGDALCIGIEGTRWANAVIGDGVVTGENEVAGIEFDGLAIEVEGALEHGGFIGAIILHSVGAEEEDHGGEVVVIDRLIGFEFDGLFEIAERFVDRPSVTVDMGEIVPDCRVVGIKFAGFLELVDRFVFLADIAEETGVGDARGDMAWMAQDEFIVGFADGLEALNDTGAEGVVGEAAAGFSKLLFRADPLIDLVLGGFVLFEEFSVLTFDRIRGVGCWGNGRRFAGGRGAWRRGGGRLGINQCEGA